MNHNFWLKELDFLQHNIQHYLTKIPETALPEKPIASAYSVQELLNHLCVLPKGYSAIIRRQAKPEVYAAFGSTETTIEALHHAIAHHTQTFKEAFLNIPAIDAQTLDIPSPFMPGKSGTPVDWTLELITHMHHHKGQLHNYCKHLGIAVNTRDVYAGKL